MASQPPAYRREAFVHWLNLSLLVAGGVAGALHDPLWWVATAGIETSVLWVLPDLPVFRAAVDKRHRSDALIEERAWYLNELWGLRPEEPDRRPWWQRMLVQRPPQDPDERLYARNRPDCEQYLEMRQIIQKLRGMMAVPGSAVSAGEVARLDVVVNGYLRLLSAARALANAVDGLDVEALREEVAGANADLATADASVRPALQERMRIAQAQIDRHPKLDATLQLLLTRARATVQQLRTIHGQALANPGVDVHGMLDEMVEKQDYLADPLGQVAADQLVADFLTEHKLAPLGGGGGSGGPALAKKAVARGRQRA